MENILQSALEYVALLLNTALSDYCQFIPENIKDIDYLIKQALGKQGIVGVIVTPNLSYRGRDISSMYYDINNAEVDITENPIINRASNKQLSSYASALDVAVSAMQYLAGPEVGDVANINPKTILTGEFENLLVSKLNFDLLTKVTS